MVLLILYIWSLTDASSYRQIDIPRYESKEQLQ